MAVKASTSITLSAVVDVVSCTRYYLLQSSTLSPPSKPTTKPPAGSWNDTEPTYTSGSTNSLYFCDLTVFSDGTWSYSSVSRSSSYEAAKDAYNRAIAAGSTASAAQAAAATAQQTVDSLQIGGRNLYIDSTAVPGYLNGSNGSIIAPDRYNKTSDFISVTPGEQYVAQIWADKPETYQPWWCLQWFDENKTYLAQPIRTTLSVGYAMQVLTAPSNACYARFGARFLMEGYVHAKLKLEKGNRATDWTPAPEDVYSDISAAEDLAISAQDSADANAVQIRRLDQNVSGLSTQFNVFSSGIEATIEDHSEILSAMSFSTEGLKVQMAGSIYYTLTDDVGYHIYQNNKEIAAFSEGKGSMEQLQMGSIICRKTSKGGWVWTEVGS